MFRELSTHSCNWTHIGSVKVATYFSLSISFFCLHQFCLSCTLYHCISLHLYIISLAHAKMYNSIYFTINLCLFVFRLVVGKHFGRTDTLEPFSAPQKDNKLLILLYDAELKVISLSHGQTDTHALAKYVKLKYI